MHNGYNNQIVHVPGNPTINEIMCALQEEEEFYVVKWSKIAATGSPLLLAAGHLGQTRVLDCMSQNLLWVSHGRFCACKHACTMLPSLCRPSTGPACHHCHGKLLSLAADHTQSFHYSATAWSPIRPAAQ